MNFHLRAAGRPASPPQSPENAARAGDCPDLGRLPHDTPFA
eukprot:COSAG01_NODE_73582_length_241_cov_295.781690_1_plen_40_part_01